MRAKKETKVWVLFGGSFLSAVCLCVLYSKPSLVALLPFALYPLFSVFRLSGSRAMAVALALLFAFSYQFWVHSWALSYTYLGLLFLVILKSSPYLLFGLTLRRGPFELAAVWCLCEWLNSLGPLGHTGGMLSHFLAPYPLLIQSASWAGPWLLSFLLAYFAASLAFAAWRHMLCILACCGILLLHGSWAFGTFHPTETLKVAVVQSCLAPELKFREPPSERAVEHLFRLTEEASTGAELVLWPETAFPKRDFRTIVKACMRAAKIARTNHCYLLLGSVEEDEEKRFVNQLSLLSPEGTFVSEYRKTRLVPFAEFLPLSNLRDFDLFSQVPQLQPGESPGLLKVDTHPVGTLICWESMNTQQARTLTMLGAKLLCIATNDEWFQKGRVAQNHFYMAIFRAVENRRSVAQAANSGISCLIDPRGRVVRQTELDISCYLRADLPLEKGLSFYTRWGDWFCYFLVLLLAALEWKQRGACFPGFGTALPPRA